MRRSRSFRSAAWCVLLLVCASCVTTKLPPVSTAGAGFEPLKDERRLWERSRDEEAKLRDNVDLYEDPLLEDYLVDIVNRLNPTGAGANRQPPETDSQAGMCGLPPRRVTRRPQASVQLTMPVGHCPAGDSRHLDLMG